MFGLFKKNAKVEGMPITLSRRVATMYKILGTHSRVFLAYKDGRGEWRGLVGYEEFREVIDSLESRLNTEREINKLILDHLELQVQPANERLEIEPMKLIPKINVSNSTGINLGIGMATGSGTQIPNTTKKSTNKK